MVLNDLLKTLDVKTKVEIWDSQDHQDFAIAETIGELLQDFENNYAMGFSKQSSIKRIQLVDRVLCITIEAGEAE